MKTERPTAHWNQLNESELTGGIEEFDSVKAAIKWLRKEE